MEYKSLTTFTLKTKYRNLMISTSFSPLTSADWNPPNLLHVQILDFCFPAKFCQEKRFKTAYKEENMKNQSFFIPYKARSPVGLIPGSSALWFMVQSQCWVGLRKEVRTTRVSSRFSPWICQGIIEGAAHFETCPQVLTRLRTAHSILYQGTKF